MKAENRSKAEKTGAASGIEAAAQSPSMPAIEVSMLSHLTPGERSIVRSLSEQNSITENFKRANTVVASRIRKSPLTGLTLSQFIPARITLCQDVLMHNRNAHCVCSSLIQAATLVNKAQGAVSLKSLGSQAGHSASRSAQAMLDCLMHAPLVALLVAHGNGEPASWIVLEKEDDVNYSKLDGVLDALEPNRMASGGKSPNVYTISKARLRTLKVMCTTNADRKLVELAALEGCSRSQRAQALGTQNLGTSADRAATEAKIKEAIDLLVAYEELARVDALADINSRLGLQINEKDVEIQLAMLQQVDEFASADDSLMAGVDDTLQERGISYATEQLDMELLSHFPDSGVLEGDAVSVDGAIEELESHLNAALPTGVTLADLTATLPQVHKEKVETLFGCEYSQFHCDVALCCRLELSPEQLSESGAMPYFSDQVSPVDTFAELEHINEVRPLRTPTVS